MIDTFTDLVSAPSRTIQLRDREYLFFGGTSYLGMGADAEFIEYALAGARMLGFSNGTSRSNNVQLRIYGEAESEAAKRFAAESALLSSSGFLVAQLAVRYFSDFGEIIYGPNTHPALWLNAKPQVDLSFDDWVDHTVQYINSSNKQRFLIVNDSLDNLRPQLFDFTSFSNINESKEIILLVDDSHGIGVTNEGRGIYKSLPTRPQIQRIVVASLAKAIGIDAGVILADEKIINRLRTSAMFLAASPPSPALLYAFLKSESVYRRNRERLESNMCFFENNTPTGLYYATGFPVYATGNPELYAKLLKKGIVISSFNYPSATDPLMNRVVINSLHTKEDLSYLLECL